MESKRTCKPYTTEEDLWIIENYRSFDNFRELVDEHNKLFTPNAKMDLNIRKFNKSFAPPEKMTLEDIEMALGYKVEIVKKKKGESNDNN